MVNSLLFQASNAGLGPRERRAQGLFQGLTALGAGLMAGGAPRVGAPAGAAAFAPGLVGFQNALQQSRRDERADLANAAALERLGFEERRVKIAEEEAARKAARRQQGIEAVDVLHRQTTEPAAMMTAAGPTVAAAQALPQYSPGEIAQLEAARATGDPKVYAQTLSNVRQNNPAYLARVAAAESEARRRGEIAALGGIVTDLGIQNPDTGEFIGAEQRRREAVQTATEEAAARQGVSGRPLTPGQAAADADFAKNVYNPWQTGERAQAEKNMGQLSVVMNELGSGKDLTGSFYAMLPDNIRATVDPEGLNVQEMVSEVVQQSLRTILGAQFTEGEGERLIARAYNPRLDEKTNQERVGRLLRSLREAYEEKNAAAAYFADNGTLRGYKGSRAWTADSIGDKAGLPKTAAGPGAVDLGGGFTLTIGE